MRVFDFPLLALQQSPDIDGSTRLMLECTSMLIGFGTIAFAVRLVRRVGRHHAPRTELSRRTLKQFASDVGRCWSWGAGAGFAGLGVLCCRPSIIGS